MVLQEFYQQIYTAYIQNEATYPYEDIFQEYPLELTIFGCECPFIVDDAIDESAGDGTDGSC